MKLKIVFFLAATVLPLTASAVTYDSHFHIIFSEKKSTSIRITNESEKRSHVVSVDVWEINDPIARVPVKSNSNDDVVFTPATQLINPGKDANFKFIYNGKEDDKERYYAIRWRDSALIRSGLSADGEHRASSQATINTSVITTLIVNPRKNNPQFVMMGGKIKNVGNSMVDFFINARCKLDKEKDCSTYRPFFPGQEIDVSAMLLNENFSVGYWLDNRKAKTLNLKTEP